MNKNNGGPAFPTPIDGVGNYADPHYAKEGVQGPGMTLREYACIHLRVPETNHDWLNELIRKSQRDEFAAKAMVYYMNEWTDGIRNGKYASEITGRADDDSAHHVIAHDAYEMADAMLRAREQ